MLAASHHLLLAPGAARGYILYAGADNTGDDHPEPTSP
jgi:hypothetical protein